MKSTTRAPTETLLRFDPHSYRSRYEDLAKFDDATLVHHFEHHGIAEGRIGSEVSLREGVLAAAKNEATVLEIGPFVRPLLTGRRIAYFDVLDRKALLARAREVQMPVEHSVEIDFVHPQGDLSVVDRTFDAVISAHAIEHQPDLIQHLNDVAGLLNDEGRYYLIVPDKRYCFDHFIAPSTVADIVDAHEHGHDRHTLRNVIEHAAYTTHNDPVLHWQGEHGQLHEETIAARTRQAVARWRAAGDEYTDVHAWQFTPASFREVTSVLHELGLVELRPAFVAETPWGRNEFTAALTR